MKQWVKSYHIASLGLNDSETVGSSTYSSNDDKLHQLLQDMLQNAADVRCKHNMSDRENLSMRYYFNINVIILEHS